MSTHDLDTLEDILYHHLQDLWAPLTDAMKVFDTHGSAQELCAQKVWEALLTAFPLDHKRMQTVLLAREIARMMHWDGDSKVDVHLPHTHTPAAADIWNWSWHWHEITSTIPMANTDRSIITRDSVKSALTLRTESRHLQLHCSTHPVPGGVIESVAIAYGATAIA
jgi:hypothetical protein